jgi:cytochrome P450
MRSLPSASGPTALRNAIAFGRDPLGFLDGLRGGTGTVRARFVIGPTLHVVTEDAPIRTVLRSEHETYHRPDILSSRTEALTSNGLIQSDGELWAAQRRRLQPLFGRDRLVDYGETIGTVAETATERWASGRRLLDAEGSDAAGGAAGRATGSTALRVDLYDELVGLTARVISGTLLSRQLTATETERFIRATATIADEFEVSPVTLLRQLLPTPPSAAYRHAIDEMHAWADEVIDARRRASDPPDDMLTHLLEAERRATGEGGAADEPWAPNLVRDEVLTFLFAGHETTALTLCYALCYVANDADVADRVRREARRVFDGDRPSWAHVDRLEYTGRVIREALRLRPPSWAIFREARTATTLGGRRVREGDFVLLPQWALHRDRRYFDRPERFDPDRWTTADPGASAAYFPFGAGPQACIGGRMALAEAQLVLATVVARFDVAIDAAAVDDLRPAGVLQPRGGLSARLTPRPDR